MTTRTTIEAELSGSQERAYGGDVWKGTITLEYKTRPDGEWQPWEKADEKVAASWVQKATGFKDLGDGDWYTARLVSLENTAPGVWTYRVERPYDD